MGNRALAATLALVAFVSFEVEGKMTKWQIKDLGYLGTPVALNNNGEIVGYDFVEKLVQNDYQYTQSTFIWRSGEERTFIFKETGSVMADSPVDINDSGVVIGNYFGYPYIGSAGECCNDPRFGYRWSPYGANSLTGEDPGNHGLASVWAISNAGHVVGTRLAYGQSYFTDEDGQQYQTNGYVAYSWGGDGLVKAGHTYDAYYGLAVNDSQHIVGAADSLANDYGSYIPNGVDAAYKPFFWTPTSGAVEMAEVCGDGFVPLARRSLNNPGYIAGVLEGEAALCSPGAWVKEVGDFSALALNDLNQILGYGKGGDIVLWSGGKVLNLTNRSHAFQEGWESLSAIDLNDNGQVLGLGLKDGSLRAFLIDPYQVAEPPLLLAVCLAFVAVSIRRRQRKGGTFKIESFPSGRSMLMTAIVRQ